jgi:Zn-dependent protease
MERLTAGAFRLGRVAGIEVFLHWSWFLVALLQVRYGATRYSHPAWAVAEYLTLFGIVLLHEFGHALACRSVGGTANRIVLWPLGGVAFVSPPPRPGAVLWSIAAGPLVNVVLVPLTVLAALLSPLVVGVNPVAVLLRGAPVPEVTHFAGSVALINLLLLLFNLLPIYPLDGGQILQALLWFVIGRWRSLQVVGVLGAVLGAVILGLTLLARWWWVALVAGFVVWRAAMGYLQARAVLAVLNGPRHEDAACPGCGAAPVAGPFWACGHCGARFDTFSAGAVCPRCGDHSALTQCPHCRGRFPLDDWYAAPVTPPRSHDRAAGTG